MTSFVLSSHIGRPPSWTANKDHCTFCSIINGEQPAWRVYENDEVIAILDIMPLRTGHVLVIPKRHISRVSELPPDIAAALGKAVTKVAEALTRALDNTGLNIVCNQEYAQAVSHVHYHIIPAPMFDGKQAPPTEPTIPTKREMHRNEFMARNILEDEDADELVVRIRARL